MNKLESIPKCKNECMLYKDNEQCSESMTYVCTRRKGHTGRHIACTLTEHNVASWKKSNSRDMKKKLKIVVSK